jgi:hypothetical protein
MTSSQQAKTGAQRVKASDDRHRLAGRVQRKVWATEFEHEQIKALLAKLRETN